MSSIFIQHMDSTIYDLDKLGFKVITFEPTGNNYVHTYFQNSKIGQDVADYSIDKMTIQLTLMIQATDPYDLELKRLDLKRIFNSEQQFYVYTTRMPYLRWSCIVDGSITYPQLDNFHWATATINLICPLGLAETVGVTTDDDFVYDKGKWGLGLNLPHGQKLQYSFTNQGTCNVYNASNIELRADGIPMDIIFNGNVDKYLTITNATTNQAFQLQGQYTPEDTIELKGLVPTVNQIQQYAKSNHEYLDFAKGWNQIIIDGASDFTISFKTRFYY